MHVISYLLLRYKLSQWKVNSLQTLVLRKYEKISLSESNNFNWSQKTMSPAHISSGRPAVFNTEFCLFPQFLQKNVGTINW